VSVLLDKEKYSAFDVRDFINLPNYKLYLKLMIDGYPSGAFNGISILTHKG
jgi:hypothetical protein